MGGRRLIKKFTLVLFWDEQIYSWIGTVVAVRAGQIDGDVTMPRKLADSACTAVMRNAVRSAIISRPSRALLFWSRLARPLQEALGKLWLLLLRIRIGSLLYP